MRSIPGAGEAVLSPFAVALTLTIKPASVVVDGDPTLAYGLEEFPSVAVRIGVPVPVPVKHGNYAIHVVERTSGRRRHREARPRARGPRRRSRAGASSPP